MVSEHETVPPQPAWGVKQHVVIFIRKDGWMLGALTELSRTAYELWADEWTHVIFITPDEDEVQMTIEQFLQLIMKDLRALVHGTLH
jgi:hypothetical protein